MKGRNYFTYLKITINILMEEAPVITQKPIQNKKKEFRAQIDGRDYVISLEKTELDDYIIFEVKTTLNEYFIKYNQYDIS